MPLAHALFPRIFLLPRVPASAGHAARRLSVVAGGLALVLSRATRTELSYRFASAAALYRQLRRRRTEVPAPGLMLEAFHEVAEVLDPVSARALHECIHGQADEAATRPFPDIDLP